MLAELIRLHTADGLTHFGALYAPQGKANPLGIVWVHGMTGSFIGEVESVAPEMFARAGYAFLVANNRGHDLKGAATEQFAGCLADIQAAIDFMAARGFEQVALLGHSKGGVKVSYYLARQGDPRVKALGLLSPAENVHDIPGWLVRGVGVRDVDKFMARLEKLVKKGKGDQMFTGKDWPYLASAGMLWDHHNLRADDVLESLKSVHVPVLALCGSLETDWCTVVTTLLQAAPAGYSVRLVEGGDHLYTGKEADMVQMVVDWLAGIEA